MTEKEKTNYMRIALGIAGIAVNRATAELIWRTCEGVNEKKGDFTVRDSARIQALIEGKYNKKRKKP